MDSALDPNQMWTEWKTKFLQIVDKHAPIRIKRVRLKTLRGLLLISKNACIIVTH